MNTFAKHTRIRRWAAALLLTTLAVRALVPVGYMPGNLTAGQIAELCPVASAATFELLGADDGHVHHHGEADAEATSLGTACPIGSALYFDALPTLAVSLDLQSFGQVEQDVFRLPLAITTVPVTRHARAPPLS